MRLRFFLAIALITLVGATAQAQNPQAKQDEVMDDFINTRGAGFSAPDAPKSSNSTRPKSTSAGNTKSGTTATGSAKNTGNKGTRPQSQQGGTKGAKQGGGKDGTAASSTQGNSKADTTVKGNSISSNQGAIGLGYTLYMKDSQGDAVRVDPSREFVKGDEIRLGLETNTDGYLYIFHTENGHDPQMLFPHPTLDGGSNRVSAHSLETVPSDLARWFLFDARPAVEKLYIVITREPLAGVPTDAALVASCGAKTDDCVWHPTPDAWRRITSTASGQIVESHAEVAQLKVPADTLKRGLTISKSEPAPSIVRMNASSTSGALVTTIDLVHK